MATKTLLSPAYKNSSFQSSDNLLRRSRVSSKLINLEELQAKEISMTRIENFISRMIIVVNIFIKSENDKTFLKTIRINITDTDSVDKVVLLAAKMFNCIFESEKIGLRLSEGESSLYKLKPAKKNGKPKDLPGIIFIL
jgi:hypothetical protein